MRLEPVLGASADFWLTREARYRGRVARLKAARFHAEAGPGPEFLRLANALSALSALHPGGSEEKRLLDGMLLAVPRVSHAMAMNERRPGGESRPPDRAAHKNSRGRHALLVVFYVMYI